MIKDIVFHIGDPKTGSSSIQKALQSRSWTCDSISIAPQKELNASALANSLKPGRGPKKYEREFAKKAQWAGETDADLGIISAEFFSSAKPRALADALEEYLPAYAQTARVVAYVRPHASRIVSSYAQRVKTGTFTDSFEELLGQKTVHQKLVYAPRFGRWQKAFGDRFVLRAFIREELRDQDVTADFFHVALRGAPFSLKQARASNETLMLEEIAGMRVVQSVLNDREVAAFLRLSIGGAIGRELAGISGRTGNKLALNRQQAEQVLTNCRADAQKLDARFFEGGPMERALVETVDRASSSIPSVSASAYFGPDRIDDLRRLAKDLAKLVKARRRAWRKTYRLRIGQAQEDDSAPLNKPQQKNADAAWAILGQIAQILAKEHIS